MNKTNQITICRSEYDTQEDFENAIKKAIMVLLDNNYIMTVRYDEKGLKIVAIDYNTSRQDWGDDYPYWLSPEEIEKALCPDDKEESENE